MTNEPKPKVSKTVCTRLEPNERRMLQAIANRESMSYSALLRVALVGYAATHLARMTEKETSDMFVRAEEVAQSKQDTAELISDLSKVVEQHISDPVVEPGAELSTEVASSELL